MKLILLVLLLTLGAVASIWTQPAKSQATEQRFKNIQVLKGLSAAELDAAMAFISGSLGVKCSHCHTNPFDKDEKSTKLTARKMMQMVFDLNGGTFNRQGAVSCFTCHRGKPRPVSVPTVGQNLWAPQPAKKEEGPLPTVDQIMANYTQALGGPAAWEKIRTRITKASRIGADGVLVPEDVYQKSPNKILTTTIYPEVSFSNGFNGKTGWGYSSRSGVQELPAEILNQLKTEAVFLKEVGIRNQYAKLLIVGRDTTTGRDSWVVEAIPHQGQPEKLYFDIESGLLIKRYVESKTIFGSFPLETEYDDYRVRDGVKIPFLIRWSMPGRSWGRKVNEVKHNEAIDDAKFEIPNGLR